MAKRDYSYIGEHIRTLRSIRGLDIQQLASKAKLHRNAVSRIEASRSGCTRIATLERIAKALDTPLSDLVRRPA